MTKRWVEVWPGCLGLDFLPGEKTALSWVGLGGSPRKGPRKPTQHPLWNPGVGWPAKGDTLAEPAQGELCTPGDEPHAQAHQGSGWLTSHDEYLGAIHHYRLTRGSGDSR